MENVWDYPRPPRVEPTARAVRVVVQGINLVHSVRALRVLETSHPPVYYVPRDDVQSPWLTPGRGSSWCEFKGHAVYWTFQGPQGTVENLAWSYPSPSRGYEALAGYLAFYPALTDGCWLDDERVLPQAGGFYGGWITQDLVGPFKG